jgi:hypothetical protein
MLIQDDNFDGMMADNDPRFITGNYADDGDQDNSLVKSYNQKVKDETNYLAK